MYSKAIAVLTMCAVWLGASSFAADAPGFSHTEVKLLTPFHAGHLGSALAVVSQGSGTCFARSVATSARPDAWRCTISNAIQDPCFENVMGDPKLLACVKTPWTPDVTLLTLSVPLPETSASNTSLKESLPWALELADGKRCTLFTGATAPVAGMRMNYGCPGGFIVVGDVDRSQPVWRVFVQGEESIALRQTDVAVAWY
jgi:hypothetical protein